MSGKTEIWLYDTADVKEAKRLARELKPGRRKGLAYPQPRTQPQLTLGRRVKKINWTKRTSEVRSHRELLTMLRAEALNDERNTRRVIRRIAVEKEVGAV
jgi:hypothetical protein